MRCKAGNFVNISERLPRMSGPVSWGGNGSPAIPMVFNGNFLEAEFTLLRAGLLRGLVAFAEIQNADLRAVARIVKNNTTIWAAGASLDNLVSDLSSVNEFYSFAANDVVRIERHYYDVNNPVTQKDTTGFVEIASARIWID